MGAMRLWMSSPGFFIDTALAMNFFSSSTAWRKSFAYIS